VSLHSTDTAECYAELEALIQPNRKRQVMKRITRTLILIVILSLAASGLGSSGARTPSRESLEQYAAPLRPGQGCTVFYASDGELALGGNNEDYFDPFTYVWFVPPEAGEYGRAYFGYEDFAPQGGVNEKGLFFDGLAVDGTVEVPQGSKPAYRGNLLDKAMAECATVECVLQLFDHYHTADRWDFQFLFGDSHGASAIIEPLAVLRGTGRFQVATNFYQSGTAPEHIYCSRYKTATKMLESADSISIDLFRDILEATHQEGLVHTLYSNIYDLKHGLIYLYYFHDYDHVVVLDLKEELALGEHDYKIAVLFPRNEAAELWAQPVTRQYEQLREQRLATDVDPNIYDDYVGQYQVPAELKDPSPPLIITRDGDRLFEVLPSSWKRELLPQSETSFFHLAFEDRRLLVYHEVSFVKDETGRVTHLIFKFEGKEFTFRRIDTVPAPREPTSAKSSTSPRENQGMSSSQCGWIVVPVVLILVALVAGYGIHKRSLKQ
jgi:hypothetical protein